jgi:FlaA1/EpsC-like NDP-sugar epimerase
LAAEHNPSFVDSFILRVAAARVAILFLFHAFVFAGCYALAWLLRFDFAIPPEYLETFKFSLLGVVGTQLIIGILFGFYRGWWRYVGITDVVRLVFGLTTAGAILTAGWYSGVQLGIPERFVRSPRGVLLVDWAFALLVLFGVRVVIRVGRDRLRPMMESPANVKRVLIVGAGDAGETLAREIEHRPQLGMKVVGFVDDQRAKWNSSIRGIRVVGPISDIGRFADRLGANEALLAIPSASGKRIRELMHHLSAADLQFKTIPGIDHLVSGRVHVTQLRPVNVEDLLRRRRIDLPGDPVRQLFKGKRVLVTGGGGTIGYELAAQVLEFEPQSLTVVERSEQLLYETQKRLRQHAAWVMNCVSFKLLDIQDTDLVRQLIDDVRPEVVLHAAAHKHVPLGEENPPEYVRNNTLATRDLAESCSQAGVERFVFISTDKAINPTSVMGASKRAAEILLLDLTRRSDMKVTIVRFGNVIGSSGSVIPLFVEQIAAGGPVTVTHPDVTRYFIRTSEAVSLVLQAATLGNDGEIYMLDMGEPVNITELARDLIRLSNQHEDEIRIVYTGLRPGEKMFEEIRLEGESIRATAHPQIVVTTGAQPSAEAAARWLHQLTQAVKDQRDVIAVLQREIPEFVRAAEASETAGADAASAVHAGLASPA